MNVLRSAYRWSLGLRPDELEVELARGPWDRLFYWGVALAGLASALCIALLGRPLVGEIVADRGTAAFFTALLSLGWLWLLRGPEHAWLGEQRLVVPGRPIERIGFDSIEELTPIGHDRLTVSYSVKGGLFGWRPLDQWLGWRSRELIRTTLRLADRDRFIRDLLRAIERDQGADFATRLNTASPEA
jgi:hypothetical protein